MNILVTTPYFYPEGGGLERYAYNIFKRLTSKGHTVTVLCATKEKEDYSEEIDGIVVKRLKPDFIISNTPIRLDFFRLLHNELTRYKYDIINSHTPVPYFAEIAALVAYKLRINYIVTFHVSETVSPSPWLNLIYRVLDVTFEPLMFKIARKIIVVNELVKQGYLAKFAHKTVVIPPGVDTSRYRPNKYNPNKKRLLFIGPLSSSYEWKGLRILLKAMQLIINTHHDATLTVIGDGPLKDEFMEICKRYNIDKNTIFKGRVSEEELIRCYQESTMLIVPSTGVDSFPLVMLEANACGIPVVASKIGGIPYYIINGFNGLLVEPRDSLVLAEKIIELLSRPKLLNELSLNSRKRALEFDWNTIADKTLSSLENIVCH